MAAVAGSDKRPIVLATLDGHTDKITQALAITGEDAIISASDDRTLRVWVKRDDGTYWPTICQTYQAATSSIAYHHRNHKLFVGLSTGLILEYRLSEDLNRMEPKRSYLAHTNRVTALKYLPDPEWLLSVGRDKTFQWHCAKTGKKLGSYESAAWCLSIEYDAKTSNAFVADYSGQIIVLQLKEDGFQHLTSLRGHQSSVRTLCYDEERRILFSGGFDQIIVVWDIGSQKGTAYELTGHRDRLRSLVYHAQTRRLISTSDDGVMGIWNMDIERQETAEWGAGSSCEKCGHPFFWNVKDMWSKKSVGLRQHHCRKCGRALCHKCSEQQSTYPPMGFEIPVRMCNDCKRQITTDDQQPLANLLELKTVITGMDLDKERGILVTVCEEKTIKIFDVKPVLT
ncbi:hypothetical protein EMCRGX_G026173 [Ephydatia muelleri]